MPSDTPLAAMSDEELFAKYGRAALRTKNPRSEYERIIGQQSMTKVAAELSRRERRSATSTSDGEQP